MGGNRDPLRGALFVLLASGAVVACGDLPANAPERELGSLELQLAGAQLDREHTGVLAVVSVSETIGLCTGTLIAPNLVLTARHCVASAPASLSSCESAELGETLSADSIWVNSMGRLDGALLSFGFFRPSDQAGNFVRVVEVHTPPNARSVCDGDLALLVLGQPLDPAVVVPVEPRLDEPVVTGEVYSAVGFGATPAIADQGTRRVRNGLSVICGPFQCSTTVPHGPTEYFAGAGVCLGDSGGPALSADSRVFGVASRSRDCETSIYSDLSQWSDWIREIASQAEELGGYSSADWIVDPVEQSSRVEPDAGADSPQSQPAMVEADEPLSPGEETPIATFGNSGNSFGGCTTSSPRRLPPVGSWGLAMAALLAAVRRPRTTGRRSPDTLRGNRSTRQ